MTTSNGSIQKRESVEIKRTVSYTTDTGIPLDLSIDDALINQEAPILERYKFMMMCMALRMHPALNELHLVQYGGKWRYVIGKYAILKRAEQDPNFHSFEAGIIVLREGKTVDIVGGVPLPGDKLYGGWVRIKRMTKAGEMAENYHSVLLDEGNVWKPTSGPWVNMPATMIRKVAMVQGIRELYPMELGGLYDSAEMSGGFIMDEDGNLEADTEIPKDMTALNDGTIEVFADEPEASPKVTGLSEYESIPVDEVDDGVFPCPDHTRELLRKRDGKYGEFWSHKTDDPELPKGYCNLSVTMVRRTLRKVSEALGWDRDDQINFEAEHIGGGGINDLFNDPSGMVRFLKVLTNKAKERDDMIREEESYQAELDEVRLGDLFDTNNN